MKISIITANGIRVRMSEEAARRMVVGSEAEETTMRTSARPTDRFNHDMARTVAERKALKFALLGR